MSLGEIVRAQGEAHLGEDALHVLRLEMFGHLAGVEDVIDVLDHRFLDELLVGEEEDAIMTQSGRNQDTIKAKSRNQDAIRKQSRSNQDAGGGGIGGGGEGDGGSG